MDVNQFVRVTVDFQVPGASNPCVMVWDYRLEVASGPVLLSAIGQDFCDAFVPRYYTALGNIVHPTVVMNHIALRSWSTPSDGYDKFGSLWAGTGGGQMMPPFVTTAVQLTRSNYLMRNGRKAYPGACTTNIGDGGKIATATQTYISVATDAWVETDFSVESDFGNLVFNDVIVRVPTTPDTEPTVFSQIPSYGLGYFGTQNSRKG